MAANLQDRLEAVRAGAPFQGHVKELVGPDGKLREDAFGILAASVASPGEPGRRKALELLIDGARRADPLFAIGGNLIRDPRVAGVLTGPALARRDGVRGDALDALLASVPPALVHQHAAALVENLLAFPDETALLVAAKAKPAGADAVEGVARSPALADTEAAAVARAAVGDGEVEKRLIEQFAIEKDPLAKERRARALGFVGTPAAQKALALELRSPLVFENPNVLRRSVRLAILEALRQSFPEERSLIETQIADDAGYERAEKFLEGALGIRYQVPRPPFLKIEGFPTRQAQP